MTTGRALAPALVAVALLETSVDEDGGAKRRAPKRASLTSRAVAAYETEHEHPGAESLRIAKRSAAVADERHRDAVSAAHRLAERLGMTLDELPRDASYRCHGDRPLAAFRCADLPADLLVTCKGNWGAGGRLVAHPLRLLDRHGYRSRWFDSLEDLGCELLRYEREGQRFDPLASADRTDRFVASGDPYSGSRSSSGVGQ